MKTLLICVLVFLTFSAQAAKVEVQLLFYKNVDHIKNSNLYIAKIDGTIVEGNCKVTVEERTLCSFEREDVDTYNGLNILLMFTGLEEKMKDFESHGALTTLIDDVVYDQRNVKLNMKNQSHSIGEFLRLGTLNINF